MIYAIVNRKGGVGKTTTAVHLAHGLTLKLRGESGANAPQGERPPRVLLLDMDPQGNCAAALGIDPGDRCLSDLLAGRATLRDVIIADTPRERGGTGRPGLFLVPATERLVDVTEELLIRDFQSYRRGKAEGGGLDDVLLDRLGNLRDAFAHIVIDCPPSLGSLTINSLTAADSVLVPMQCEYFALEGLAQLVQTIRKVKKTLNRDLFIEGLLLTMYDRRNRLTHSVASEIQNHFGDQVYKTVIPRNVRLSESPSHGQTIIEYDANCSGAKAYRQLGGEFLKRARAEA